MIENQSFFDMKSYGLFFALLEKTEYESPLPIIAKKNTTYTPSVCIFDRSCLVSRALPDISLSNATHISFSDRLTFQNPWGCFIRFIGCNNVKVMLIESLLSLKASSLKGVSWIMFFRLLIVSEKT